MPLLKGEDFKLFDLNWDDFSDISKDYQIQQNQYFDEGIHSFYLEPFRNEKRKKLLIL